MCAVDFTMRQFVSPICLALQQDGHEVIAACSRGIHWAELEQMGLTLHEIPIARSSNPMRILGSAWKISRWLRRIRPDVLHVHTPIASIVGRIAALLARVPCVVYTAHGFYFHDQMPTLKRTVHFQLENVLSLLTNCLILVNGADRKYADRFWFLSRRRIRVIENGADVLRFNPERFDAAFRKTLRESLSIPSDAIVVTIMGRLVREKGYLEFFEAARIISRKRTDVHFLAIGDTVASEHDDAKAAILEAANAPELRGRVTFTGMRSDIPELLSISDIFCQPSWREGLPVSVIEAMLMALPTVGTDIRGTRDLIAEGQTGYLVPARDAKALAAKLTKLIEDPELRDRMGESAITTAVEHYNQEEQLAKYRKFFNDLSKRISR